MMFKPSPCPENRNRYTHILHLLPTLQGTGAEPNLCGCFPQHDRDQEWSRPPHPLRVSSTKVPLLLAATLAAACDQGTSTAGGGDLATTFDTTEPRQPWAGVSPLGAASLGATAVSNVEVKIGEEAGGPSALLLPVPTDGSELTQLGEDIKGGAVLAEAPTTGWDQGRAAAGTQRDWVASRLGPEIPEELRGVHKDMLGRVLQACGIPAPLASVEPMGEVLATEASEKLDADVAFDFAGVWAHDLQGRATAYASLVGAGMQPSEAREAVGL